MYAEDFEDLQKLARYIVTHGEVMNESEIKEVQQTHYGSQRRHAGELKSWIDHVATMHGKKPEHNVTLAIKRQQTFWPEKQLGVGTVRIHAISKNETRPSC